MKRLTFLVTLVLLTASAAFAQNGIFAPYATAAASASANLGYKTPDFTLGAGIESSTKHVLADLHANIDTANLASQNLKNGGYTGTITGSAYLKIFGHFLAGAGANWSANTADLTSSFKRVRNNPTTLQLVSDFYAAKQSAHPFIGGGFQFPRWRLLADYNLPGKDARPDERTFNVSSEIFVGKHVRFTQNALINSFKDDGSVATKGTFILKGTRLVGEQLGVGLKLVL